MRRFALPSIAQFVVVSLAAAAPPARFVALGTLDAGASLPGSIATDVSANGRAVAGMSYVQGSAGLEAHGFLWTPVAGMRDLGSAGEFDSAMAGAISDDGRVIVGSTGIGSDDGSYEPQRGVLWTARGPLPPGRGRTIAPLAWVFNDISGDGLVAVGSTRPLSAPPDPLSTRACYWSNDTGLVVLGTLTGGAYAVATAASRDGSVIVGYGDGGDFDHAWRWTASDGMQPLADSPFFESRATGVSADGGVIVGWRENAAFRYTEATGMVFIPSLPSGMLASPMGVTSDGNVIVGSNLLFSGGLEGFIWDPVHETRVLREVLIADYGLPLEGWSLFSATAISDDGRFLVGSGVNPQGMFEAWLVQLPAP